MNTIFSYLKLFQTSLQKIFNILDTTFKNFLKNTEESGWSNWSSWSKCSNECSPGITTRTRTCQNNASNQLEKVTCKENESSETKPCNEASCSRWSDWMPDGDCQAQCKRRGYRIFKRVCNTNPFDFDYQSLKSTCYSQMRACVSEKGCPSDNKYTFGEWNQWSACSQSCTRGFQERSRVCFVGGKPVNEMECPAGDLKEKRTCNSKLCIIWSEWEISKSCDAKCESAGYEIYNKTCLRKPIKFDLNYHDESCYKEKKSCISEKECFKEWSSWENWSACSSDCSPGTSVRTRKCIDNSNLVLDNSECENSDDYIQKQKCNTDLCPAWSDWQPIENCTAECRSKAEQKFEKTCKKSTSLSMHAKKCYEETRTCYGPLICPPEWGSWESWSDCSDSCSPGLHQRVRPCLNENGTVVEVSQCENPESFIEEEKCNIDLCPDWSEWIASESCTAECRSSTDQLFVKSCKQNVELDLHDIKCYEETRTCYGPPICPPHWGDWEAWSTCSEDCTPGIKHRTRPCLNENGTVVFNAECSNPESFTESKPCNTNFCPHWLQWQPSESCNALCRSTSNQKFNRMCKENVELEVHQSFCYEEIRTCSGAPICPPEWGGWQPWSNCSSSCTPGIRERIRNCFNENGTLVDDLQCSSMSSSLQTEVCNSNLCSLWSNWTAAENCSALCRSLADQTFVRTCFEETDIEEHDSDCYLETRVCSGAPICPPEWGSWKPWSSCSDSCSPGFKERQRPCLSENGTEVSNNECKDPFSFVEEQSCNSHLCPYWSNWTPENDCLAECRKTANQTWQRSCNTTIDLSLHIESCYTESRVCYGAAVCPPQWGEWGSWSLCSEVCVPGVTTRKRKCINENGTMVDVSECTGDESYLQTQDCNEELCPKWLPWFEAENCSAECRSTADQPFKRSCSVFVDLSTHNESCYSETRTCLGVPVCPPEWGEWNAWSLCSESCGPGIKERTRQCLNENGTKVDNSQCPDTLSYIEEDVCNSDLCSQWSEWQPTESCKAKCRQTSSQKFTKTCLVNTDLNLHNKTCYEDTRRCNGPPICPAQWGLWQEWSNCSNICSPGKQTRERFCFNENATLVENSECPKQGLNLETKTCNENLCSVWYDWEPAEECDAPCRSTSMQRWKRMCSSETKNFRLRSHQRMCYAEMRECEGPPTCPPEWGDWGEWSQCSTSCTPGFRTRTRSCLTEFGDLTQNGDCGNEENFLEEGECNEEMCSDWSEFTLATPCNAFCEEEGTIEWKRQCKSPSSFSSNAQCEKNVTKCFGDLCPGIFGPWSDWSYCDSLCSPTWHNRTRSCYVKGELVESSRCEDGEPYEEKQCQEDFCEIWNDWQETSCEASCNSLGFLVKTRTCSYPMYNKMDTPEECTSQTVECFRECIFSWGPWTEWSKCSNKCAVGETKRTRGCLLDGEPVELEQCADLEIGEPADQEEIVREGNTEVKVCNIGICPKWSTWVVGSCTASMCGQRGIQKRNRVCQSNRSFSPKTAQIFDQSCYTDFKECKGYCRAVFSQWSQWAMCDEKCGEGETFRTRSCVQKGKPVDPKFCADTRFGNSNSNETKACNRGMCNNWSEWKEIGKCSAECNGKVTVMRRCNGKGLVRPQSARPRDQSCMLKVLVI